MNHCFVLHNDLHVDTQHNIVILYLHCDKNVDIQHIAILYLHNDQRVDTQ